VWKVAGLAEGSGCVDYRDGENVNEKKVSDPKKPYFALTFLSKQHRP